MALGMLGLKVGMTQVFDDKGQAIPVTVLQVGPCPVLLIRYKEKPANPEVQGGYIDRADGYDAVQLGFLDVKRHKATQAMRGHVSGDFNKEERKARGQRLRPKAECEPQRYIREFRLEGPATVKVGDVLKAAEVFKDVKAVDVIGTSKGHGFAGVMKRHGFAGLPAAHGAKKVHRSAGSIGSHASNRGSGRPKKGHKAAGHYGNVRTTVRNLKIVRIDADNHLVLVKGAVPGPNGGLILIRPTNKKG